MTKARTFVDTALLLFVATLITLYALALNELFYSKFGPFYDSMDYLNKLARVMWATSQDGFLTGVGLTTSGSTVLLPFVEGAVLGLFQKPTRSLGVLIQAPWLFSFVISGYFYFRHCARLPSAAAVCLSMSLISFAGIMSFNGGLSDFRMDLLQTLTFGASTALYLVARERSSIWLWVLLGMLLAASCLCRATTPVYIVMVFGAFALADIFSPRRKQLLLGLLVSASTAVLLSGWYFVLNFDDLYYYYVIWNPDANARLPLRQSYWHLVFVKGNLGWPICLTLLLSVVTGLADKPYRLQQLNWRPLWAGLAPVSYLVLSGSGLNPLVSMVSIPGIMMFALAPFAPFQGASASPRWRTYAVAGAALLASGFSLSAGISNHLSKVSDWAPTRQSMSEVRHVIAQAADDSPGRALTFGAAYSGALDAIAIVNSFIYDENFRIDRYSCLSKDEIKLFPIKRDLSSKVSWNALSGSSDLEKVATLAQLIISSADIIILVDSSTPPVASAHTQINRYAKEIGDMLRSYDGMQLLRGPIAISPRESVNIYRNRSPLLKPGNPC